jgi:hypothetical protein
LALQTPGLPLQADAATMALPADTKSVASDAGGATPAQSTGADARQSRLAILWLALDSAKNGKWLKAGDLISVGSFTLPTRHVERPGTLRVAGHSRLEARPACHEGSVVAGDLLAHSEDPSGKALVANAFDRRILAVVHELGVVAGKHD